MISNKRTKNRRIIARHNENPEKKAYIPDPNFPYSICQTCAFLIQAESMHANTNVRKPRRPRQAARQKRDKRALRHIQAEETRG